MVHVLLVLTTAVALGSCSTVRYYTQAIGGQAEIMRKARSIPKVLADPKTSTTLRDRLTLVQDIREFAQTQLHLPAQHQYGRYTDLVRPYVVWVVFATPEFSVKAHDWWYPVIGRLTYRGYFREAPAKQEAARLEALGLDVFVHGVAAYSTLGFFHDPILNTFVGRSDAQLAELLFHELTHQRLYLSGDTDFNEAFATATGQEGARRWLRARGRIQELRDYERRCRIQQEFVGHVLQTRAELKDLYETADDQADAAALRRAKADAFLRLRQRLDAMNRRHGGILKIDDWFELPVNNARLNTAATYHDLVPGFEAMLQSADGNLETFFKEVGAMRSLSKSDRRKRLLPAGAGERMGEN